MKPFCLPPAKVMEFKKALKNEEIKIADLINADSATRTEILRKYAGNLAPEVNLLFEKKLVLKNRIRGIKNWARKVGEMGRYSPKGKAAFEKKLAEYKEAQNERIFNPKENEAFLNDLADSKMGTHITREEAKQLFDLTKRSENLRKGFDDIKEEWRSDKERLEYGAAKVLEEKYFNALQSEELTIPEMLRKRYSEFKGTWKENKPKAVTDVVSDFIKEFVDTSISMVASVDNSFLGRQGLVTLQTHPSAWATAARKSFTDIFTVLTKKNGREMAIDAAMADVYSRPNYLNGSYERAKLIPKHEEQFPTSIPGRVPVLGRPFKASEVAFSNSAIRMRTDLFDLLSETAKRNGRDVLAPEFIDSVGKLVNSATARGSFGKYEHAAPVLKLVLWAPKMMKGHIDVLTAHMGGAGLKDPFAARQAKINLAKIVGETAAIAAIINALDPGSVEINPTSTDFMRYRRGDTRFDLTGGLGSYATLGARFIATFAGQPIKSATGKYIYLAEEGYKARNLFDVGTDFLVNKTHPVSRAAIDKMKGKTFKGKKPTAGTLAYNIATPIAIQNFVDMYWEEGNKDEAAEFLAALADVFGIGANTYSYNKGTQKPFGKTTKDKPFP